MTRNRAEHPEDTENVLQKPYLGFCRRQTGSSKRPQAIAEYTVLFNILIIGSNASTFVGAAACVLGSVSVLTSAVTGGSLQILSVGDNAIAGAMVSVAAVIIGGALVASRETVGGVTSLLLASTLVFGGMVSINMGNFFRVLSATSEAIGSIDINVNTAATPKSEWLKIRELSPDEQAECDAGTAAWTNTPAGRRNCTGGGVYRRGG